MSDMSLLNKQLYLFKKQYDEVRADSVELLRRGRHFLVVQSIALLALVLRLDLWLALVEKSAWFLLALVPLLVCLGIGLILNLNALRVYAGFVNAFQLTKIYRDEIEPAGLEETDFLRNRIRDYKHATSLNLEANEALGDRTRILMVPLGASLVLAALLVLATTVMAAL
ncbi:MAG: hypothetical protein H7A21_12270 [Spirochaetales bacterium]|nr:hypothetical protein [Leptospiraceae bacterium]MCP5482203.1 hypothetical protein [Spirochaetales bacterium]MCP5484685.1 hypothetical protein [Spirochaetales bacterium]